MVFMAVPEGLFYFPNAIPEDLATDITEYLQYLEEENLDWYAVGTGKNSRKVIQYGFHYDYNSGNVRQPAPAIPPIIMQLVQIAQDNFPGFTTDQCIINRYLPGQGISAHIDHKDYDDVICCFTLGSGCEMLFTRGSSRYSQWVDSRSMYIMSGPARSQWRHEMPARQSDRVDGVTRARGVRYSITFRKVKPLL